MIFASKSTLSQNNLKILRPKVAKNLTNLRKNFCESTPCTLKSSRQITLPFRNIAFLEFGPLRARPSRDSVFSEKQKTKLDKIADV